MPACPTLPTLHAFPAIAHAPALRTRNRSTTGTAPTVNQPQEHQTYCDAPARRQVCERLLEEAGLLADVQLRDFPLEWVPLDEDLLSLEMPTAFKVPLPAFSEFFFWLLKEGASLLCPTRKILASTFTWGTWKLAHRCKDGGPGLLRLGNCLPPAHFLFQFLYVHLF